MKGAEVRAKRIATGIVPVMKAVDTCGAGVPRPRRRTSTRRTRRSPRSPEPEKRVLILGSGPNRIGQGLEFDYCCVQAALELKTRGFEVLIAELNPETVSTDYDVSSRLCLAAHRGGRAERRGRREPIGVIVQLGGQTPPKLRGRCTGRACRFSASYDGLDLAEPARGSASSSRRPHAARGAASPVRETALACADALSYPVLVRPSYVLGVRHARRVLAPRPRGLAAARSAISDDEPVLLDKFLEGAPIDVDAGVRRRDRAEIGAVMEHIREAGGIPGRLHRASRRSRSATTVNEVTAHHGCAFARALGVKGLLMNVQYAVRHDHVYVLRSEPARFAHGATRGKAVGILLACASPRASPTGERLSDIRRRSLT